MRKLIKFLLALLPPVLCLLFVWLIFGEMTITATIDGKPLSGATIVMDGEKIGETPFSSRMMVFGGNHSVRIIPPDELQTQESEYKGIIRNFLIGNDLQVEFTTARASEVKVLISATFNGRPVHGASVDVDGETLGSTPLEVTLTEGTYNIVVAPPIAIDPAEHYMEFTFKAEGQGREALIAAFTPLN